MPKTADIMSTKLSHQLLFLLLTLLFFAPAYPQQQRRTKGDGGGGGGQGRGSSKSIKGGGGGIGGGGGCPKSRSQLRGQYYRNLAKWEREAPSTICYNMTIKPTCFCVLEYTQPHYVQVRNGVIVNSTTDPYAVQMPTIDRLFRILYDNCLKNCPESGAAECRVEFNETYGYIQSIYIDQSSMVIDEERNFTVSDLEFCAGT